MRAPAFPRQRHAEDTAASDVNGTEASPPSIDDRTGRAVHTAANGGVVNGGHRSKEAPLEPSVPSESTAPSLEVPPVLPRSRIGALIIFSADLIGMGFALLI